VKRKDEREKSKTKQKPLELTSIMGGYLSLDFLPSPSALGCSLESSVSLFLWFIQGLWL
jgi:hypothetical protein